jgi:hypothetical protein
MKSKPSFVVGNKVSLKDPIPGLPAGTPGHVTSILSGVGCEVEFRKDNKPTYRAVSFYLLNKG